MISAWLLAQLGAGLAVGGAWVALRLRPFDASRIQRAALLCVPAVMLGAQIGPMERPFAPAAQVFSQGGGVTGVSVGTAAITAPVDTAHVPVPLFALGLLLVLPPIVGLARSLRGARILRRIGSVRILIAPRARTPFAVWLGVPLVVLDPDTALDPALAEVAVRHELQHHRQRDPMWAWALVALRILSPAALLLRPLFAAAEELRCDHAVTRRVPAVGYAEALLRFASRPSPTPLAAGLGGIPLRWRLTMLLRPPSSSRARRFAAAALAPALLLVAAPLGWAADGLVAEAPQATAAATLLESAGFFGADHPRVQAALDRVNATASRRAWMDAALERSTTQRGYIEARLVAAGLPAVLSAVPLVESGYENLTGATLSPKVPAHQRGAGYWMFIPSTAQKYGLRVDGVDERLDLEKETTAAINLLREDYARYGDWALALAAYNQGERAVDAAIAEGGTRDAFALADRGLLNDYVDQVYAAAILMHRTDATGAAPK